MTITNVGPKDVTLYYQITYALTDVPEDAAYSTRIQAREPAALQRRVHHSGERER